MQIAEKLQLIDMSKKYPNGDGVAHIDMTVNTGELFTMLGPSGCGKSTILRTIGGFTPVTGGRIEIDGTCVNDIPPEKRPTSMVFQNYNLWPHMTVYENLAFGLKLRKMPKEQITSEVERGLKLVRMDGFAGQYPDQLSGGQQQRVAIARSILLKPSVLLLDEPFSALDAKIRQQMRHELKTIQRKIDTTVIFVTHDQEEAMILSDRIAVMNKGKIAQIGRPVEIYDHPVNRFVASFIGDMNFIGQENGEEWAIRPEDLLLTPTDREESKWMGTVVSVVVLGRSYEIKVQVGDREMTSNSPRMEGQMLRPGQRVKLGFRRHLVFKEDGPEALAYEENGHLSQEEKIPTTMTSHSFPKPGIFAPVSIEQ